ncbi:MAG: carboxypeptidase regulatory-like domain-containing protein [Candidatus Margulisiibacteriota bacterium]
MKKLFILLILLLMPVTLLMAEGSFSGKVYVYENGAWAPTSDAEVHLHWASPVYNGHTAYGDWHQVTTNAQGEFLVTVNPGVATAPYQYQIRATKDSCILEYYDNVLESQEASLRTVFEVTSNGSLIFGTYPSINFYLIKPNVITGNVSSGGQPLSGISVNIFTMPGWGNYQDVYTDINGDYRVTLNSEGGYYLRAGNGTENYITEYYNDVYSVDDAVSISVVSGMVTGGINFNLFSLAYITGNVSSGGQPLEGITVNIFTMPGYANYQDVLTDANGDYRVTINHEGGYYFRTGTGTEDYRTQFYNDAALIENAQSINITTGLVTGSINFNLLHQEMITGSVTAVGGGALSSAVIKVFYSSSGTDWAYETETTTGLDGGYEVRVPTGAYKLQASTGNYVPVLYGWNTLLSSWNAGTTVDVTEGAVVGGIDFQLVLGSRVTGTVTDGSNNPVGGAVIKILTVTGSYITETTTGEAGTYNIQGIPTGTIKVSATSFNITIYYNNFLNINNAAALELAPGQVLSAIDFRLATSSIGTTFNISITTPSSLVVADRIFYLEGTISYPDIVPAITIFNTSGGTITGVTINGSSWISTPPVYLVAGDNRLLVYALASPNVTTAQITVRWVQEKKTVVDNTIGTTLNIEVTPGSYPSTNVLSAVLVASQNVSASSGAAPTGTSFVLAMDITLNASIAPTWSPTIDISVVVPAGVSTQNMNVYYWDVSANAWTLDGINNVSLSGRILSFTVYHLSRFAVLSGAINSRAPTISITPVYDAIAGEQLTINVTVADEATINSVLLHYQDGTAAGTTVSMVLNGAIANPVGGGVTGIYRYTIPAGQITATSSIIYDVYADDGVYQSRSSTYSITVKALAAAGLELTEVINYPNPFGDSGTTFYYVLSEDADVITDIYTLRGEKIKRLRSYSGETGGQRGVNRITWNGRNDFAEDVANGVYLYIVIADNVGNQVSRKGKLAVLR